MYDPYPHGPGSYGPHHPHPPVHPYGPAYPPGPPYPPYPPYWPPPRRRRLNAKGWTVLLVIFAILCAIGLGILKIGLAVWHSDVTAKVIDSAARIGTAAADAAMEQAQVPEELRKVVTKEAETLRREVLGTPPAQNASAPATKAR